MTQRQHFLFLQGVCSPFFPALGQALRHRGHKVQKVNFSVGDSVYWRQGGTIPYRGPMSGLKDFYQIQYDKNKVTDIVLFGDCRPVHRPAIQLAKALGINVHVFEEGYFRPFWITLERGGVNGNSELSRDPEWYRKEAVGLPHFDNGQSFSSPFWKRAAYDVGYNFWAGANRIFHNGVRSHVPYSPLTEYIGYAKRGARVKFNASSSRRAEAHLIAEAKDAPFFLMPLQLATDSQIVHHSAYANMAEALYEAVASFARHAAPHTRFAAKIHPLDPGLVDYRTLLQTWARELGVADRVFFLDCGNLPALISHTAGVVTVNSTVGASALLHGKPTFAMGNALYNIKGLTFQDSMDRFWSNGRKPDAKLFKNFRDVVISKTQVNGGFYSSAGIRLAVKNSLEKIAPSSFGLVRAKNITSSPCSGEILGHAKK